MRRVTPCLLALLAGLARAEVVVVDDAGTRHRFAAPVARLVTLAPHLTELVFAAGAGSALVGRDSYSDFPPRAAAATDVGDAFRLDLERLAALRPEAVLAWGGGTPDAVRKRIAALGIPVMVLEPMTLDDPARQLELLGMLTGHAREAQAEARAYRARLAALRARYAHATPVRAFYQVNSQPLYTINGQQPIGQMLALCGGLNPFAALTALAPLVSEEAVVAADPETILTGAGEGGSVQGLRERWSRWPTLSAAKHDAFFALDASLVTRPGPRMVEGAERVCEALDQVRRSLGRR